MILKRSVGKNSGKTSRKFFKKLLDILESKIQFQNNQGKHFFFFKEKKRKLLINQIKYDSLGNMKNCREHSRKLFLTCSLLLVVYLQQTISTLVEMQKSWKWSKSWFLCDRCDPFSRPLPFSVWFSETLSRPCTVLLSSDLSLCSTHTAVMLLRRQCNQSGGHLPSIPFHPEICLVNVTRQQPV